MPQLITPNAFCKIFLSHLLICDTLCNTFLLFFAIKVCFLRFCIFKNYFQLFSNNFFQFIFSFDHSQQVVWYYYYVITRKIENRIIFNLIKPIASKLSRNITQDKLPTKCMIHWSRGQKRSHVKSKAKRPSIKIHDYLLVSSRHK